MPNELRRAALSDTEMTLMKTVRDSGVINYDQLGRLVATVTPQLFDPGVVADDYIATGYSSVIKVYKMQSGILENIPELRTLSQDIKK